MSITLEQLAARLAAIEAKLGIAPPVEPEPVDSELPIVEVDRYKAIHLRAPGITKAQVCHWQIGDIVRGGFNAAFAPMEAGEVMRCLHADIGVRAKVRESTFALVDPGTDLSPLIVNGARLQLKPGAYTLSRNVNAKNVIIVGSVLNPESVVVKWTGEDLYPNSTSPRTLFLVSDSAFWHLTFDCDRPYNVNNPTIEKSRRPVLFGAGNDNTFVGVRALGFNRMFHPAGSKRWLVRDCFADEKTRTYFAWWEGEDLVFYDNECANTIFEHIARAGPSSATSTYGYSHVAFDGNHFGNKDNRPADPNDTAKGTIVCQAGQFVYRRNNVLDGPTGLGPLAVGDSGSANQFTDHAVVENDQTVKPLELWPGLRDALIIGTPVEVKQPRNLDGPKLDPRKVSGLTLVGVAAPPAKPWIENVTVRAGVP